MRTQLRNALMGAVIGGGIAVLGITAASAAETDGEDGILSGTQGLLGIEAPITIGGNSISLLGDTLSLGGSSASAEGSAGGAAGDGATTDGGDGVASGTQAVLPISIPITVGGNAISLLGDAGSAGGAPSSAPTGSPPARRSRRRSASRSP